MELEGEIIYIGETQALGANGFRKREMAIRTNEQYPQEILVEFTQDKCDLINSYKIGENVKMSINLKGRSWVNPQGETKYFNTVSAWRIARTGAPMSPSEQYNANRAAQTQPNPQPPAEYKEEEHDDLPF